jgi:uncharacterized protein (TIGR02246 family)
MTADEQAIRELIAEWLRCTASGDVPGVLRLMSEDVVFLTPGRPPLRGRAAFAAGAEAMRDRVRIEATSRIEEVRVIGDWAYCWGELAVTVTPREGGPPTRRSGHTLTILRRPPDDAWVVIRDANMLA